MNVVSIIRWFMGAYEPIEGDGRRRAAARLEEKRKANALIPSHNRVTRQHTRYITRLMQKRARISDERKTTAGGMAARPSWRSYAA